MKQVLLILIAILISYAIGQSKLVALKDTTILDSVEVLKKAYNKSRLRNTADSQRVENKALHIQERLRKINNKFNIKKEKTWHSLAGF